MSSKKLTFRVNNKILKLNPYSAGSTLQPYKLKLSSPKIKDPISFFRKWGLVGLLHGPAFPVRVDNFDSNRSDLTSEILCKGLKS